MKTSQPPATFTRFRLESALLKALEERGYHTPTSIQLQAIPQILEGGDLLAGAETGSGKTAAYALPLLQNLIKQRYQDGPNAAKGHHVRAIVLVPTRELAVQVREEITRFACHIEPEVKCRIAVGGEPLQKQAEFFAKGVDVLVATPERLLDLNKIGALKFNKMRTLVVDEVDRMTSAPFRDEFDDVIKQFPESCQKLMFTATLPDSIRELVRKILTEPTVININPRNRARFEQHAYRVNSHNKIALVKALLQQHDWSQVLLFCNSKKQCNDLQQQLKNDGIDAEALHGNVPIEQRKTAMGSFRNGSLRVLIATDIAARGIDILKLPCVINYDLPREPTDFLHRIGRTGRTGATGTAITLVTPADEAHFVVVQERCNQQLTLELPDGFELTEEQRPVAVAKPAAKKKTKTSRRDKARKEAKQQRAKSKKIDEAKQKKTAKAASTGKPERQKATEKGENATAKVKQKHTPYARQEKPRATPASDTAKSSSPYNKPDTAKSPSPYNKPDSAKSPSPYNKPDAAKSSSPYAKADKPKAPKADTDDSSAAAKTSVTAADVWKNRG